MSLNSNGTWRNNLSFSDRTAEYKSANPDVSSAEASRRAKSLEAAIFGEAVEILDYQHRCNELLEELRHDARITLDSTVGHGEVDDSQHGTQKIGRYQNASHFRDGLYSDIYKTIAPASNPDDFKGLPGAPVALKVTYLIGMQPPHNSEREVRILKRLAHPNIIPLWESFREPGYSHLVLVFPFMPYDLDAILKQGYIAEATGRGYLRGLFAALAYVHSQGIIHRDIKPSNILMKTPNGPAILADFGIIWSPDDKDCELPDEKITDVGTTSYRAPDVMFGRKSYGTSIDLWAAGCVAAQIVTSSSTPLFESGDLGSDLMLIQSIFKKLGTPTIETWPDAELCPDWGKIQWVEYPPKPWSELLPNASEAARNLVAQLVRYQGSHRLTAEKALEHPYLATT